MWSWAGVKGFLVHPCPTPATCLLYGGSSQTFPSTNTKQIPRMTGFQKVLVRETQHCWSLKQHQSKLPLVTKAPFASAIIKGSAEGKGKHSSKHRAPISLSCVPWRQFKGPARLGLWVVHSTTLRQDREGIYGDTHGKGKEPLLSKSD